MEDVDFNVLVVLAVCSCCFFLCYDISIIFNLDFGRYWDSVGIDKNCKYRPLPAFPFT